MLFLVVHFGGSDDLGVHHRAGGLVSLVHGKGLDAHAAAIGFTIHGLALAVAQRRGLAVAFFADHQQVLVLGIVDHVKRHDPVLASEIVLELEADNAGGVTVPLRDAVDWTQQRLSLLGDQDHGCVALRRAHRNQLIAVQHLHRNQAGLPQVLQLARTQGVHPAVPGGENVQTVVLVAAGRQHGLHVFTRLQGYEVHQQDAPRRAPRVVGRLVDAEGIHATLVSEEQQLFVGIHHRDLHDRVVIPVVRAAHALAPAPLVAVGADGHALDVPALAQRDHHVFLHDELFDGLLLQFLADDLGAPRVSVLALDLAGFPLDLSSDLLRVLQQILQPGNGRQQVIVFFVQALSLQGSQPAQLHVENGLGLDL